MFIADEETEKFWFYLILMGAAMISLVIRQIFFGRKATANKFHKTKAQIPSHVKDGEYVKLIGKALHTEETMNAPLSGRECIYYRVKVEREGRRSSYAIVDDEKGNDFFLEVNGEQVIVRLSGLNNHVKVRLNKDHFTESGYMNDASMKVNNFLKRYGKSSTTLFGTNKTLRYEEGIISLGEMVAVMGVAKWKYLDEPIEGYPYSKILELTGNNKKTLWITDYREVTKSREM